MSSHHWTILHPVKHDVTKARIHEFTTLDCPDEGRMVWDEILFGIW